MLRSSLEFTMLAARKDEAEGYRRSDAPIIQSIWEVVAALQFCRACTMA